MSVRKITIDIETVSATRHFSVESMDIALVGIHDSLTDTYHSFLKPELPALWPILEHSEMIIGFNSDHFDIPILNKYYPGDLTLIKSVDLLFEIKKSLGRRIKLDSIAEATLGKKKSGSGLEAIEWFREGNIEKVRDYCLDDVKITKEIYEFALQNGFVEYMDFKEKRRIPLDTRTWESAKRATMNHTLPF